MSNDYKRDMYERSTIRDPKIKISTTNPELKDKIHYNISSSSDKAHWYIKFNISLDPRSVNKRTMNVTETNGYILDTLISYDSEKNMIIISPTDIYMQNEYYLLNVSKKVRSEKGQYLKKEIHIMFKLIDNQISEFELLKSTVKVANPKHRTRQYRKELREKISASKVYTFDDKVFESVPQYKLPYASLKVNFVLGVVGIIVTVISLFMQMSNLIAFGLLICFIGIVHIFIQLIGETRRSMLNYNVGVLFFNASKYYKAQKRFKKAIAISESNEMAEHGLNKTNFYL